MTGNVTQVLKVLLKAHCGSSSVSVCPGPTVLRVAGRGRLSITAVGGGGSRWGGLRWGSEDKQVIDGRRRWVSVLLLQGGGLWSPQGVDQAPPGERRRRSPALLLHHAGQQLGQLGDVDLRHLQRVVLGQLLLVLQRRDDAPQLVEGLVQAVHPPALPGVGGHAPVPLRAPASSTCCATDGRRGQRAPLRPLRALWVGGDPSCGTEVTLLQRREVLRVVGPAWKLGFSSHGWGWGGGGGPGMDRSQLVSGAASAPQSFIVPCCHSHQQPCSLWPCCQTTSQQRSTFLPPLCVCNSITTQGEGEGGIHYLEACMFGDKRGKKGRLVWLINKFLENWFWTKFWAQMSCCCYFLFY